MEGSPVPLAKGTKEEELLLLLLLLSRLPLLNEPHERACMSMAISTVSCVHFPGRQAASRDTAFWGPAWEGFRALAASRRQLDWIACRQERGLRVATRVIMLKSEEKRRS